jgi:hypothetical protein
MNARVVVTIDDCILLFYGVICGCLCMLWLLGGWHGLMVWYCML